MRAASLTDSSVPEPEYLHLPKVKIASAGSLPFRAASVIDVDIEPWPGIAAGDVVWLHWIGSQYGGSLIRPLAITDTLIRTGVAFQVDNFYVLANTYGSVQVSYLIDRVNGRSVSSGCEIFSVPGLEPPSVDGVRLIRFDLPPVLSFVAVSEGVTVRVAPYTGMQVDDTLIISWRGQQPGSNFVERVSIDAEDVGQEIVVQIPLSFLRYSVTRAQLIEVQYLLVPAHGVELASPMCRPFLIGGLPLPDSSLPTYATAMRDMPWGK